MNAELFRNYLDGRLTAAETVRLKHLLAHNAAAQRDLAQYVLEEGLFVESAGMVAEALQQAGQAPVAGRGTGRRSMSLKAWWPVAIAASLAIFAGVWWLQPAGPLGVRVVEIQGSGFRVQGAGDRVQGSGFRRQAIATASSSHPVTESTATSHKPLKLGDVLRPGDGVEVGVDGVVKLAYRDGTQVELRQCTRLRVTLGTGADKDAKRLALDGGLLVCSVAHQKKPFLLETAQAVAEVVGTRFSLAENRDQTTLALQDGRVDLHQKDQRLEVRAGETAVADAAGMRKLAPADAWIRELLVRAETGPWDAVNLGTGVYSNDVWRMDTRGGPAERRIWNMPVEASDARVASVVQLAEVRRPIRGVITCRMMIRPDGQPAPEVDGAQAVTNDAWRTSRLSRADQIPIPWRKSRRGSLRLDYSMSGTVNYWAGDVPNADEHLIGVWHRFVVYVDREPPDGVHIVYSAWPDGSVPSPAAAWMAEHEKSNVADTVKIGLMAKGVLMEVQGIKFVPLGADLPLPPKELLDRK